MGGMFDFVLFEKIDRLWRLCFAQSVVLFLSIINMISFYLPMTGEIRPYFILMAVYYWTIFRPTLLHPVILFFIGIIFDLVAGFPLGIHAVLFLLTQWVINTQRLFFMGQTYLVVWIGFALTCLSVLIIEWFFFSALAMHWINIKPVISSFIVTILLFPVITLLFISVQRLLPVVPKSHI